MHPLKWGGAINLHYEILLLKISLFGLIFNSTN